MITDLNELEEDIFQHQCIAEASQAVDTGNTSKMAIVLKMSNISTYSVSTYPIPIQFIMFNYFLFKCVCVTLLQLMLPEFISYLMCTLHNAKLYIEQ